MGRGRALCAPPRAGKSLGKQRKFRTLLVCEFTLDKATDQDKAQKSKSQLEELSSVLT